MDEFQSRRTIEEVLDLETGEILSSKAFFNQEEERIIYFRRLQQEAILGYRNPKFVCIFCNQIVKISGKPTRRGQVSFFAHLYDSEECEIKTNGEYSKEEIEAIKYAGVKESQRHIYLKESIYKALMSEVSREKGFNNVQMEKRVDSENPLLGWRRPDVYAEYKNRKVVFELQLSTTFLSVIIARDIFYRMNNMFITWVFNFSSNDEYVNLENLMCKDIYYGNKRNAFVYDEEAKIYSERLKELVLCCIWFEPKVEEGKFVALKYQQYVKFSELQFDDEKFKPFHVDADKMFLSFYPDQLTERIRSELENQMWLERLEENHRKRLEEHRVKYELLEQERRVKQELLEKEHKRKVEEIIEGIHHGDYAVSPIKKNGKWGYESQGEIIIAPVYSSVTNFDENGLAKVRQNRKFGLIDKFGKHVVPCIYDEILESLSTDLLKVKRDKKLGCLNVDGFEIIPCEYDEILDIKCSRFLVRSGKRWSMIDCNNTLIKLLFPYQDISIFQKDLDLLRITRKVTTKTLIGRNYGGYNVYRTNHRLCVGIMDFEANILIPANYSYISYFEGGKALGVVDGVSGPIELVGNDLKSFIYELKDFNEHGIGRAKKNGYYGFNNKDDKEVIPFIYQEINDFVGGVARARRDDNWGEIAIDGKEIFEWIGEYNHDGIAPAKLFGRLGLIDKQHNRLCPFEYETMDLDESNLIYKAKKNDLYGYVNSNGQVIIPFFYEIIDSFFDGLAKVKRNDFWGYIDSKGNEVIPCQFECVSLCTNNNVIAQRNGKVGMIDLSGNVIIPFIYQLINDFKDGIANVKRDNVWGKVDINGKERCEIFGTYDEGIGLARMFDRYGVMNWMTDEELCPFVYEDVVLDTSIGIYKAKKNGLYGYIDSKGNEVVPCQFELIESFTEKSAIARKDGREGTIDFLGNVIIPFIYEEIRFYDGIRVIAKKSGRWGLIDINGREITKFEYQQIFDRKNGFYKVMRLNKWGYLDYSGRLRVNIIYYELGDFDEGPTKIRQKDTYIEVLGLAKYVYIKGSQKVRGYVNKAGEEYWQFWKD